MCVTLRPTVIYLGPTANNRIAPFQFHNSASFIRVHVVRADYEIKLTANSCIALCSSKNAVSISSARTMKR